MQWHPTPVLLPGKSHGRRSLEGCSPWGCWGSGTTERLHFHFSLTCTGEGNGNPLQCSCLENPRDGAAWWAAVYGVAQSRTPLRWLSSSSTFIFASVSFSYPAQTIVNFFFFLSSRLTVLPLLPNGESLSLLTGVLYLAVSVFQISNWVILAGGGGLFCPFENWPTHHCT